jgi:hypothetical protein
MYDKKRLEDVIRRYKKAVEVGKKVREEKGKA